jgi:hypothetical protein
VKLPQAKPFDNISVRLRVKAELLQQQTKEGSTVEHRVRNVEGGDQSYEDNSYLLTNAYFSSPVN